jgi:phenylalanyl-tRNA synthetase beta chain
VSGKTIEEERTALLITGQRTREHWRVEQVKSDPADVQAEVELLLDRCGLADLAVVPVQDPLLASAIEWRVKDTVFARAGAVLADVCKAFDVSQPVFYAELCDAAWLNVLARRRTEFAEVPKFPTVRRDLSLLLDKAVTFAQLERIASQSERKLLQGVELFDVYEGDKLPAGKKSYALSFLLQDAERTLTDEQVEKAMGRIRQAFEKEVGAELRG